MPEEPGFFSYENFPYPLLALGQAIPRGYQYQSQMTPYKRDARGDWGRAVNESIDQFFQMYPQFLQQKRQFALQREQLQRQRADDAHKAKLRPFELKKLETESAPQDRRVEMLKNYPEMVQSLPDWISDKDKAYLAGLPPTEGLPLVTSFLKKRIENPKLQTFMPGEGPNPSNVPIQVDERGKITTPFGNQPQKKLIPVPPNDPRLAQFEKAQHPFLKLDMTHGGAGEIVSDQGYSATMQKQDILEGRPSATNRFKSWLAEGNRVESYADLERFAGKSLESKLWFATQNLPANDQLHIDAQNQLNLKFIKSSPKGFIIGKGYKDPNNPGAFQRLPEPTSKLIESGTNLNKIAADFKTTPSQIIAANPLWFGKENGRINPNDMRTSAEMGGAEMVIPTGKSKLSDSQIRDAHSSYYKGGMIEMPYGTIIPMHTATVSEGIKLNTERLSMVNIQKSLTDFVALMADPKARGIGKFGLEKGQLEGIRQRLINNVQVLRDYGVLSPSEIENIERSVPDVNSFIALATRGLGSDEYFVGQLDKMYEEVVTRERLLSSMMKVYSTPQAQNVERFSGTIPGLEALIGRSHGGVGVQKRIDSFRSQPTSEP